MYSEASRIFKECNLSIWDPSAPMISFDKINHLDFIKLASSKLKESNSQSFEWFNGNEEDDDNLSADINLTDSPGLPNVSSSTTYGMMELDYFW